MAVHGKRYRQTRWTIDREQVAVLLFGFGIARLIAERPGEVVGGKQRSTVLGPERPR